ncbi:MAG: hypothetical protein ABTQ30_15125 [Rhizobiaceae bacterium]
MTCSRVTLPNGVTAIVCGPRRRRPAKAAAAEPSLPLEGGGETESFRLGRLMACIGREAGKRRTLYARWVAAGRMMPETAERGLSEIAEIVEVLRTARRGEPLPRKHVFDRMIGAVAREIDQRRRVYPKMVADGRMTGAAADREIAEMADVLLWLQQQRRTA